MRLLRAEVNGAPRVLLDAGGERSLATVGGAEFGDLPELLEAAGGDASRVRAGAHVEAAASDDRLLPVVGRPRKIICVGRNYGAHAAERGAEVPPHPMLFAKWPTSHCHTSLSVTRIRAPTTAPRTDGCSTAAMAASFMSATQAT